jgi:hypothetical protein
MFIFLIKAIHSKLTNWGITGLINLRIGTVLTFTHTQNTRERKEGIREKKGPFTQNTPPSTTTHTRFLSLKHRPLGDFINLLFY